MQSLMLLAGILSYHDTFLGKLSPDLKDSIYKSQNSKLYVMDVPGKALVHV